VGRLPEVYHGIYFLGFVYAPSREVVLATLGLGVFLSFLVCYFDFKRVKRIV